MKLSIIIVNFNVTQLLKSCLQSIQKYVVDVDFEIIVVDNNSSDSSWKSLVQEFSWVTFIESKENIGFSRANNLGIKKAKGEYLLILNPDTELEGFYMKDLLSFADSKSNFGCLGVRMHDAEGCFLPESKRSIPDMFNSFEKLFIFSTLQNYNIKSYYRNDVKEYDIAEIEVITGAFLLIKKEIYHLVGGLDNAYFMYGEDIDLCYTLLKKGYKNYYYGKASLLHYKGESTVKDKMYLKRFYGAMFIFVKKYYSNRPFQYWLLKIGLKLKYTLELIKLK